MATAMTASPLSKAERRQKQKDFDSMVAYANSFDKGGKWQKRRKARVDKEMKLLTGSTGRKPQKEDQDTSIELLEEIINLEVEPVVKTAVEPVFVLANFVKQQANILKQQAPLPCVRYYEKDEWFKIKHAFYLDLELIMNKHEYLSREDLDMQITILKKYPRLETSIQAFVGFSRGWPSRNINLEISS